MSTLTRREFTASALALCSATFGASVAHSADHPPIIDTHQHLWDLGKLKLEWIAPGSILDRNYLPADYAQATAGLGIAQAVYMEVAVVASQQTDEARWVTDLCESKSGPTRSAIISGRPDSPDFAAYLDQFRDNKYIKGLRQVLHVESTPAGHCVSEKFIAGIRELGKRNLSFDLCPRGEELDYCVQLVDACPDTRFILDHCGNPNVKAAPSAKWLAGIVKLAKRPNVAAKISGIIASSDKNKPLVPQLAPFINHVWDSFGPERVVFGGDWPVCLNGGTYAQWVNTLRDIASGRSRADQQKLFHDNALRVYQLEKV